MIEHTEIFAGVNRQLIKDNEDKIKINKRTRRYKITPTFIEATEIMEKIIDFN